MRALRTDRLDLAPVRPEDAEDMVAVLADDRLYDVIGGAPPTLDQLRDLYHRLAVGDSADGSEEWHNWILRRREDAQAIGVVQATIVDGGRADIAWVVGVPWQGLGFASEAAQAVVAWLSARGTRTITAHIEAGHQPSEKVAARSGLLLTDEIEDGERIWRRDS